MDIFKESLKSGIGGFKAKTIQIISLNWLKTIMNYQNNNGTSFKKTIKILYKEGGIKRFFLGITPSLIQGPIIRFGDTFCNEIILDLMEKSNKSIFIKTFISSSTACLFRILMNPLHNFKIIYQIEGKNAKKIIKEKIKKNGFISLYQGSFGNGFLNLISSYPWFAVHNFLNNYIPQFNNNQFNLLREAYIGFTSSFVSDCLTNSLRVVKTKKHIDKDNKSYYEIYNEIINKDGIKQLMFRGLETRILINGIQGLTFNVLWKYFKLNKKNENINL